MRRVLVFVLSAVMLSPVLADAQHDHQMTGSPDEVGGAHVHFETSCAAATASDFNRGVALLHSFWFPQAAATFERILEADPACAMAHWGIALSHWGNPFGGLKTPVQVDAGRAAIDRAQSTGAPTPRERLYIDAAAALFTSREPGTQRARVLAHEQGMARLVEQFPEDLEARIFHALALNQTALPSDQTYTQQIKAAAILEPFFLAHPNHPGVAHYIIHAYDHPPLADKALEAARRYASLAPAVPHALHMPSHTFTRVGYWRESIEANRRSADAARKSSTAGEELHALDYQTYAYLQIAQDDQARRVLEVALTLVDGAEGIAIGATGAGAFAIAAIPARYALERAAWSEAAALPVRQASTFHTMAMSHFARALGAARSGVPSAAAADIAALAALRDKLAAIPDAYWAGQVDIQRRVAEAWVAFADGRRDEGVNGLRAAADAEDATDKAAISPGPLAPARELLGDMLLEAGRPAEALEAFEATMAKEPNRFRGLWGGARAAEAVGDVPRARQYYRRLLDVVGDGASDRPELRHARAMVR